MGTGSTGQSGANVGGINPHLFCGLIRRKIRVNVISPGVIETSMSAELSEQLKTILVNNTPLGRMGKPDEIAKAVAFLASDDSSYITGIELSIDGGIAQI
jgi:3-oxoacyl-[acyl-carrier protein] reductase